MAVVPWQTKGRRGSKGLNLPIALKVGLLVTRALKCLTPVNLKAPLTAGVLSLRNRRISSRVRIACRCVQICTVADRTPGKRPARLSLRKWAPKRDYRRKVGRPRRRPMCA